MSIISAANAFLAVINNEPEHHTTAAKNPLQEHFSELAEEITKGRVELERRLIDLSKRFSDAADRIGQSHSSVFDTNAMRDARELEVTLKVRSVEMRSLAEVMSDMHWKNMPERQQRCLDALKAFGREVAS